MEGVVRGGAVSLQGALEPGSFLHPEPLCPVLCWGRL